MSELENCPFCGGPALTQNDKWTACLCGATAPTKIWNRRLHPSPQGVRVPDASFLELDYGYSPGESPGAIACKIGDYSSLDEREWATVLYNDMKIAECYSNKDAELIANALNAYRELALHDQQNTGKPADQII